MRALPIVLAFFPSFVFAEDIALTSDVSAVTLYPQGATITREIPFTAPAGQHQLILTDLPRNTPLQSVRVAVEGALMGSLTVRNDFTPPRGKDTDAAIIAAKDEVERLEQALRDGQAGVARIRLEHDAAEARVAFLRQLGDGEGVAKMDVAALRELVGMIGDETLSAKQVAHDARLRADAAERDLKDAREDLDAAYQALQALVPEVKERAMLAVSVSNEADVTGVMTVTYNIWDASWQPVYDLKLDRAAGELAFQRGAFVAQSTGENWTDVALTLSTVRPSEQSEPGQIWPQLRRIEDPAKVRQKQLERAQGVGVLLSEDYAAAAVPVAEAESAVAYFNGLSVTYNYPSVVNIASGADNVRIALGDLSTSADIIAQAVPMRDPNAFLMAKITNDMNELILPGVTSIYLDDRYIGQRQMALIAAGDTVDLPFGPIEGLRLTRTVLDRNEGDRGIISKSNEFAEEVEIKVENLTGEAWPVRVLDVVPYSEQEDLEIDWQAQPRPSEQDVDGKRGILAWNFDLKAGAAQTISLSHEIEWPDGQILR